MSSIYGVRAWVIQNWPCVDSDLVDFRSVVTHPTDSNCTCATCLRAICTIRPTDIGHYLRSTCIPYYWLSPSVTSPNGVRHATFKIMDANLGFGAGFWSVKPTDDTMWLIARAMSHWGFTKWKMAFGVIEHTGKVIEYENGWRSDRATIRGLMIHDEANKLELEQRYQCDVHVAPFAGDIGGAEHIQFGFTGAKGILELQDSMKPQESQQKGLQA